MNIEDRTILVLGGYGLVGMAVCRELLTRKPARLQIHSLKAEESESARDELLEEWPDAPITISHGDIFASNATTSLGEIQAQIGHLHQDALGSFLLYQLLTEVKPDVVVDCVNTSTAIAYRDLFKQASRLFEQLAGGDGAPDREAAEAVLEALYVPRLIRHVQVLYRGMIDGGTRVYTKVGTTGTGGMGLNIPYTHSEERPSRVLLSKSAMAGAQSMLLFLMARTPEAPITKEIKPAAAIAWKRIAHGPVKRKGKTLYLVDAEPRPLGETFSSHDEAAARVRQDEPLEAAYIDTGENGIFSLEEFSTLTTAEQMEFVTPEEIARYLIIEIEGGSTGHDIMNALDNAVLGPTYRAGLLRHWALERMTELQAEHGTHSVAFEMLGPPRISKLLFEAHLLQQAFGTMEAVRKSDAEAVCQRLNTLVTEQPEVANQVAAVGIPILLEDGRLIRGPEVISPKDLDRAPVTPESVDNWAYDGWVDLRQANCGLWVDRFQAIVDEVASIPDDETSSRYLRSKRFWDGERRIQPGKVVGWILSIEEKGARIKR